MTWRAISGKLYRHSALVRQQPCARVQHTSPATSYTRVNNPHLQSGISSNVVASYVYSSTQVGPWLFYQIASYDAASNTWAAVPRAVLALDVHGGAHVHEHVE